MSMLNSFFFATFDLGGLGAVSADPSVSSMALFLSLHCRQCGDRGRALPCQSIFIWNALSVNLYHSLLNECNEERSVCPWSQNVVSRLIRISLNICTSSEWWPVDKHYNIFMKDLAFTYERTVLQMLSHFCRSQLIVNLFSHETQSQ